MSEQKRWRFTLDELPPSSNHIYGVNQAGRRYLTPEAVAFHDLVRAAAIKVGFQPSLKHTYGIVIVLRMPDWDTLDIDNGTKLILDRALSSRTDHRVIHLLIDKQVRPYKAPRTDVEVWRVGAGGIMAWLRELLALEETEETEEVPEP